MCNCGSTEDLNVCLTVAKQNGIPRRLWIRSEMFHFASLDEGQCHVQRQRLV